MPPLHLAWILSSAPSPQTLGGALHCLILVREVAGLGQNGRQAPLLDFMQRFAVLLFVNDIWHFYHGLIFLLLL